MNEIFNDHALLRI